MKNILSNIFDKNDNLLGLIYLILDLIMTYLSVQFVGLLFEFDIETKLGLSVFVFALLYLVIFIILGISFNLYSNSNMKVYDIIMGITISSLITSIIILVLDSVFFRLATSHRILAFTLFIIYLGIIIMRLIISKIYHTIREKQKLLVIGVTGESDTLVRKIKYSSLDWFNSWYIGINPNDNDEIEKFLNTTLQEYDNIFITNSITDDVRKKIIQAAIDENKDIFFQPGLYDIHITKYSIIQFNDIPAFRIKSFKLNPVQRFFKRLTDILLSSIALIIFSPLFLIVALTIKIQDGGNVIYTQERVTIDNKIFNIYKFRTMLENAEKHSGPVLAIHNDSRITRIGKMLRALRIDELPQLVNILKGDMSIVGPRPERPSFVEEFSKTIPDYKNRHIVKAGLTGYAQVYAHYSTNVNDKLFYDILYIREYSYLLDIKLILLTIKTIFKRDASMGITTESNTQSKVL